MGNAENIQGKGQRSALELDRAKNAFLANISHEIRTPLNGIIGLASLLRSSLLSQEQKSYTDMILKSGESLMALIDNVLDYSKMEAGLWKSQMETFGIRPAICEAVNSVAVQAYSKGIEFACSISPDVPASVYGDRQHLAQIIANLASNAVKFTQHGHILVRCTRYAGDTQEEMLHFSISDTGKGISPQHIESIFERFTQEDDSISRAHGGAGLGLAICRQMVDRLGGKIWVESEPGFGTIFHIALPFKTVLEKKAYCNIFPSHKFRVLIVSPESCINTQTISAYFEHLKIPFRHVHNSMAIGTVGRKFDYLILAGELAEDKDKSFFDTLRNIFKPNRVIILATPFHYLHWSGEKKFDQIHIIPKPAKICPLLEILAGKMPAPHQLVPKESALQISPPASEPNEGAALRSHQYNILIAEDNEINQIFARRTLEKCGHRITIVYNGIEAVKAFEQTKFDLILMDIQMPEMDGLEATEKIRKIEKKGRSYTPIVALTASTPTRNWDECRAAGMDGFISKPISAAALEKKVKQIGGRQKHKDSIKTAPPHESENGYEHALAALGGDTRLFKELIEIVRNRWPQLIEQTKHAYKSSDWQALAKTLHTIKGSVNVFASPDFLPAVAKHMEAAKSAEPLPQKECDRFLQAEYKNLADMRRKNEEASANMP